MGAPIELRFADFEVSLRSGELRRNGLKIKLQEQPFQILVLLLEQRGETVTREELRQKLWTADTFVDFDNGLNIAIKKLRTALGDDAGAPRYIETLPRRGYRFIAPVTAYEFRVQGSSDVFDAILHQTPPSFARLNLEEPPEPERIANMLVAKDRNLCVTDGSETRADLKLLKRETDRSAKEPGVADSSTQLEAPPSAVGSSTSTLIVAAAVIATLAVAAAFGLYKLVNRTSLTPDTRNMRIRPLTDDGQAVGYAGVSPDGRLVAYVRREGERSLRVKQVATGTEVTVIPAQTGFYADGLTFTPDGNYLYYDHRDPTNGNIVSVYSVPALGGTSRKIVSDVASGVTFSPDGKRMAYLRTLHQSGQDQLLVANADGSGEEVILRRESQVSFMMTNPSWSASQNLIALGSSESGKADSIVVLTPQGKLVKSFPLALRVGDVAWAPGLSGLFFIGGGKLTDMLPQIWFQPYPAGQAFKVSNDFNIYNSLSVTADGLSLITTQEREAAAIYVADSPARLNDKIDWKLIRISSQRATGYDISWTGAGTLLQEDARFHVYETAGDGSGRVDLLGMDDLAFAATACGSGDIVVLSRFLDSNKPSIWRLNLATDELKQLTFGRAEAYPSCTPDGRWVVYQGFLAKDSVAHIFKVSISGGVPEELARGNVFPPVVSPDGALVVYGRADGQGADAKREWVVQRLEDGAVIHEFETPSRDNWLSWQETGWTPDGHAITYVHNTTGSAQNVYMQPLAGGQPVQLTHFDEEPALIAWYAWSRDGKKFAITRARYNDTDVVMFNNFR